MADPASGLAAASGLVDLVAAALLVNGGLFLFFGTLGVLRFPDVFNKLHAQTKATTLGLGSVLLAFAVLALPAPAGTQALAGILFILLTAPASATAIARAALKAGRADVFPWEAAKDGTAGEPGQAPEGAGEEDQAAGKAGAAGETAGAAGETAGAGGGDRPGAAAGGTAGPGGTGPAEDPDPAGGPAAP